jgi:hypothetical protein
MISNAANSGSKESVRKMVQLGCVPGLCKLIEHDEVRAISVALEGIIAILGNYELDPENETFNTYALAVAECGGLDRIRDLQNHALTACSQPAQTILETYFGADYELYLAKKRGLLTKNARSPLKA